MKRYLSCMFLLLTAIIIVVGLRIDTQWSGMVTWGLAVISLLFAAFYSKYIPNEDNESGE